MTLWHCVDTKKLATVGWLMKARCSSAGMGVGKVKPSISHQLYTHTPSNPSKMLYATCNHTMLKCHQFNFFLLLRSHFVHYFSHQIKGWRICRFQRDKKCVLSWRNYCLFVFNKNRVGKCQGYDGYIRVKKLASWGKKFGRPK